MAQVVEQDPLINHTANGVTTLFAFPFQVLLSTDLVVLLDGVPTTTGFSVSGLGVQSGGSITFGVAPANGVEITIYRDTEIRRDTEYQSNGDFLSPVVNADFNRPLLILQEIASGGKAPVASVRAPRGEVLTQLPAAASRANKVLSFDSDGQPVVATPVSGDATDLAVQLASSDDPAEGAGQIGVDDGLAYAAGTAGRLLTAHMVLASEFSGTVTQKIDAAIAAADGRLVVIPPDMAAGEPTTYPVGSPIIDLRGSVGAGSGRKTLFDFSDANGSNVMTVVNDMTAPTLSHAAVLGLGRSTGALPNNRNIQGGQFVAYTIGAITGGGTGYVVSGIECGAGVNSTSTGVVGFCWGGHSYAATDATSTNNITEVASWRFLPASHNGTGAVTDLYTIIVDDASGTATNKGAALIKGNTLIRGNLTIDRAGTALNANMLSGGATALAYLELGRVTGDVRFGAAGAIGDFFTGTAQGDAVVYTIGSKALHFGINSALAVTLDTSGNFIPKLNTSAPALGTNGQMVFALTTNTNLRISVRGTDGTTRVANITLA